MVTIVLFFGIYLNTSIKEIEFGTDGGLDFEYFLENL